MNFLDFLAPPTTEMHILDGEWRVAFGNSSKADVDGKPTLTTTLSGQCSAVSFEGYPPTGGLSFCAQIDLSDTEFLIIQLSVYPQKPMSVFFELCLTRSLVT